MTNPTITVLIPFAVGERVQLLVDIWDDGQDHHPPGYLARRGEVLIVRSLDPGHEFPVLVSHEEVTDRSFRVGLGEIRTWKQEQRG
jgi:hypothetical protein